MKRISKISEIYLKLNTATKASVWFMFCSLFQKGIQFLFTPVLTRFLTTSEYGQYSVFISWYEILSIFATLNLSYYVLNNGMVKYISDKEGFVSSLQTLGIVSTIICFILYICFYRFWYAITGLTLFIMIPMFVEFFIMPSFQLYTQRLKYDYEYKPILYLTIFMWLLIPVSSVLLIMIMDDRGLAAIYGRVFGSVIISFVAFIILRSRSKVIVKLEYWKFALRFNMPLIPHFLSGIILVAADRIMIERMFTNTEAGIYSLAYSVSMVPLVVNTSINSSFIPYTYKQLEQGKTAGIKKNATMLVAGIAVLNLIFILIAPELIMILGTSEYTEAIYIVPPIAMSGLFIFIFNLSVNIEYFFEENIFVPIASIAAALSNILLNYVFMKIFGYFAAGYTTLLTYVLYALGHTVFMRKATRKHLSFSSIYNDKLIWIISGGAVMLALLIQIVYDSLIFRYSLLLVVALGILLYRKRISEIFANITNR